MPATLFRRVYSTIGPALVLAVGSMLLYPGGTPLDATSVRYSLSQNFLSDLGMTVAYDGQPNRLGASLFIASLVLLVLGAGSCMTTVIRRAAAAPGARAYARVAGACLLLACAAFTGVAMTPENRVMALHESFTFWAWRMVAAVAVLMALATARSAVFGRRAAVAWALLALGLVGYATILEWGPSVDWPDGLLVQVIAQKAATSIVILGLVYVAREVDRVHLEPSIARA